MLEKLAPVLIGLALVALAGGGIAGCTYVVGENNRQYYDAMHRCMEGGGTWIPVSTGGSSAACVAR